MSTAPLDDQRADIAAVWHLLGRLNLVDGAFNHISQSTLAGEKTFLDINPGHSGALSTSPADFKRIELRSYGDGDAERLGVSPDALRLHSELHLARGRPGCVIHLHAPCSVAVGATEPGLLPLSQTALEFSGDLALVEYRGLVRDGLPCPTLAKLARDGGEALLRNHGLLVVADDPIQAFYAAYYLEEACRLQILTLSQGLPLRYPEPAAIAATAALLRRERPAAARATYRAMALRFGIEQ